MGGKGKTIRGDVEMRQRRGKALFFSSPPQIFVYLTS